MELPATLPFSKVALQTVSCRRPQTIGDVHPQRSVSPVVFLTPLSCLLSLNKTCAMSTNLDMYILGEKPCGFPTYRNLLLNRFRNIPDSTRTTKHPF